MRTNVARMMYSGGIVLGACCLGLLLAAPLAAGDKNEAPDETQAKQALAFVPLGNAELKDARNEICRAVRALEKRLDRAGENAPAWRKYLKLEVLRAEMRRGNEPNLEKLNDIHARLNRDHDNNSLRLVWFMDLKSALRRYVNIAGAMEDPKIAGAYRDLADKTLPEQLAAFKANPTPAGAHDVGRLLGWLEDFRQAEGMIRDIRKDCARPNVFLNVSHDFLASAIAGPIDETTPIDDVILGTTIHGSGQTKGQVTVELVPCRKQAIIETVLSGKTDSQSTGYNGPVTICTTGVTEFTGRKRLVVTAAGVEAPPATSDAATSSKINGICTRRGCRLVERAAWRRAYQQKCLAEAISAQHAECRLNRRMDTQADESVADANQRYDKRFRKPLRERQVFPEKLALSTTQKQIRIRALRAAYDQLAAPSDPPKVAVPADLAMRVHESTINNSAATLLAGRRVTEEAFLKTVEEIFGEVPENLQPEDGKPTWAIDFAQREPFTVTFAEDGFTVSIHANGYEREGRSYSGMNVSATYKIERSDEGFVAVRQGDLGVYPPGFVKGQDRLSGSQQALREMLERRFAKIFSEKIVPKPYLEPKGRWEKIGRVPLVEWNTQNGWMTIAWKLAEKSE